MRRGGRSRRWLVGAAVVLLPIAVGIAVVVSVLPGQSETDALLRKWEDAGGATTLDAWRPDDVPDADNAAVVYAEAIAAIERLPDDQFNALRDGALDEPTLAALAALRDAIDSVIEGSRRPACRWPDVVYEDLLETRFEHLSSMRTVTFVLAAEARRAAEEGEIDRAVESIGAMRRVAGHVWREPVLISKLVALAIDGMAVGTFDSIFADRPLPEDVDAALTSALGENRVRRAMLDEGSFGIFVIRQRADEDLAFRLLKHYDLEAYIEMMLRVLEEVERPVPQRQWDFTDADALPLLAMQSQKLARAHGNAAQAIERSVRLDRVARQAVALRRYRDEHGAYPDEDQWTMPIDPLSGKPLEYERTAEGFVIRSNAADDPGPVEWQWE